MRNALNYDAQAMFEMMEGIDCKDETICKWLEANPGKMRKVYWNNIMETYNAVVKWLTDEVKQNPEEAVKIAKKIAEDEIMYSNERLYNLRNEDEAKWGPVYTENEAASRDAEVEALLWP